MANGDTYEGEFVHGVKTGKGLIVSDGGSTTLEGDWKDNKLDGTGTERKGKKVRYSGEFKEGKKHGRGVYMLDDGSKYIGEFKNGKIHGEGVYIYNASSSKSRYLGTFNENAMTGIGRLEMKNGVVFEGSEQGGQVILKKSAKKTKKKARGFLGHLVDDYMQVSMKDGELTLLDENHRPISTL